MKIRDIELRQFRNIRHIHLQPHPRINVLVGQNGHGKTSVLEGIAFLSQLRSFRATKHQETIQEGASQANVRASIENIDSQNQIWEHALDVEIKTDRKTAKIDERVVRSTADYMLSVFRAVVFQPADHGLIRGEPKRRRLYLDQLLAGSQVETMRVCRDYYRVVEHRNRLLKTLDLGAHFGAQEELETFTEQCALLGAKLTQLRMQTVAFMNAYLPEIVHKIAPDQQPVRMAIVSDWLGDSAGQDTEASIQELEAKLTEELRKSSRVERLAKTTLVGPHRDDWKIELGNADLKERGSQGETRSVLLGLKFAELRYYEAKTRVKPVLLLDDLSSELDAVRREFLLRFLRETDLQVFVTMTDDLSFTVESKRFVISEGALCLQK